MRRKILVFTLLAILITLHLPTPSHAAEPDTKSPTLWGTNYYQEFWSPDTTSMLSKLPLSYVRWGGNASDGALSKDITIPIFAGLMRKQNAEPIFQVSMLSGSPEDAAALVKFVNVEKNGGMKYWSVGNEPELFKATHNNDITLEDYLKQWRDKVTAMKAVDPSILIVGPDVSLHMSSFSKSSRDWQWFDAFVKANGDLTDVISFHFYPYGPEKPSRESILKSIDLYAQSLSDMRDYLKSKLKRDVPIMLTETNINWSSGAGGDASGSSIMAGLWFAEICGISAQQGLASVLLWAAYNDGNISLLDLMNEPRPTYYAMQAYAGFGMPIKDALSSIDGIKLYASTTDKGMILVLTNRTDQDVNVNLSTDISLGSDHTIPLNSVKLGAYSFTRLEFDDKGVFVAGTTYGEKEYTDKTPPSAVTLESTTR